MNTEALPPFVDAFPWAVVRMATYMPAHGARSRLLFGSVSLLTPDRAKPVSSIGVDRCTVKPIQARVFVRQVVMSAAEALAWYRSEGGVDFRTPVPTEPGEINEKLDGQPIESGIFADNPEWPQLALPLAEGLFGPDSGDPAPFMGSVPSRLHRRFGDGEGFEAVTADAEAVLFLKHRLHIDLAEYPEYLGGLALVVPDPVIQRIDSFLIPSQGSEPEKVMRRLVARAGQSLEGLRMTILEKRTNLLSRFETRDVPTDGVVVVPQKLPAEESGYVVTHCDHGVLVYGSPATFIRSVHLNMGIVGRIVTVQAQKTDSPTSAVDPYQVWEIAKESPVIVGQGAVIPGTSRVAEAEVRRKRRAQARRYDQIWFEDGSRDMALAFIRARIGRARRRVLVADPYFGPTQIGQFLYAVPRIEVAIMILTSRLAFEADDVSEDPQEETREGSRVAAEAMTCNQNRATNAKTKPRQLEQKRLEAFAKSLAALTASADPGTKDVSARVLQGRTPPLHDRFLVVDDMVWFMGHSFNALGDRGSLILQVPDPDPILNRLRAMVTEATPFSAYREERMKSAGGDLKKRKGNP